MVQLSDIEALLAEAETDRKKGHEEVDAKYAATVDAIKVVHDLLKRRGASHDGNGTVKQVETGEFQPGLAIPRASEWPGPRQAVRNAVPPGQFTLDDIMNSLRTTYPDRELPRVLISGELYALKQKGEITIVQKGRGNVPNVYTKGGPSDEQS